MHNKLDVMDYIYKEMFDAMVCRTTIPYAPYIMDAHQEHCLEPQVFRSRDLCSSLNKEAICPQSKALCSYRDSFMADARC